MRQDKVPLDEIAYSGKEQYYIGTWNVRSMNQSKLEVVKQEMNINIIGISELRCSGLGFDLRECCGWFDLLSRA